MGVSASQFGWAAMVSPAGISGVVDLLPGQKAAASVERMDSSTNVIAPRTALPTVLHEISPGEVWIGTLIFGIPFGEAVGGWYAKWNDAQSQSGHHTLAEYRKKYRLE